MSSAAYDASSSSSPSIIVGLFTASHPQKARAMSRLLGLDSLHAEMRADLHGEKEDGPRVQAGEEATYGDAETGGKGFAGV